MQIEAAGFLEQVALQECSNQNENRRTFYRFTLDKIEIADKNQRHKYPDHKLCTEKEQKSTHQKAGQLICDLTIPGQKTEAGINDQ